MRAEKPNKKATSLLSEIFNMADREDCDAASRADEWFRVSPGVAGFGKVLEFIRSKTTIPAVLLTNGTMLQFRQVREAAASANVVKVSFSAWNQASYGWVNRPHMKLQFDQLVKGQKAFRAQFKGQLWILSESTITK